MSKNSTLSSEIGHAKTIVDQERYPSCKCDHDHSCHLEEGAEAFSLKKELPKPKVSKQKQPPKRIVKAKKSPSKKASPDTKHR